MRKKIIILSSVLIFLFVTGQSKGQTFSTPLSYLEYIDKEFKSISKDLWDYTSSVAHGKSARKVENRRKDVLKTITSSTGTIKRMPGYNDDESLRDSVVSFLKLSQQVLNNDYSNIVDMEEIAEQSYDMMEAYLLAQEKANEKLDMANDMVLAEQKKFADQYKITILEGKDKIGKKLESANKVFKYYNTIYLIFFKSFKQEVFMIEALDKGDVNALEQNRNSLIKNISEGIAKLDTLKSFKNDNSVKEACKTVLKFYETESTEHIPGLTDFLLKKDNFTKIRISFEAKRESERTQQDVDQYNKAVNDFNQAVNNYNTINQKLNEQRSNVLTAWEKTIQSFFNRHIIKYK